MTRVHDRDDAAELFGALADTLECDRATTAARVSPGPTRQKPA
jgi:hypothetical protein